MRMNFQPAVLAQAEGELANPNPVVAGVALALLEASRGEAGARFTLRRALAQSDGTPPTAVEMRRRLTAAIAAADWQSASASLTEAYPGLSVELALGGEATSAGGQGDVFTGEIFAGGRVRFDLSRATYVSPHMGYAINRWLAGMPVFQAYAASGSPKTGTFTFNVGPRQRYAGLTYCANKPGAWMLPDPDFLGSGGHARARQAPRVQGWDDRRPVAYWRGSARDLARVEAVAGGLAGALDIGVITLGVVQQPAPYRWALDLEGSGGGTAGLFARLLSGATLLRVAQADDCRIWLDSRLVAGTHYVPVAADLSDLGERLEWLRTQDAEARRIGENGRKFALSVSYEAEMQAAVVTLGQALR
jgi:hypothetical protein